MINNAVNGVIKIDGTDMDYISFGKGKEYLIIIPGLGDGLKTVKGLALPFSVMYKCVTETWSFLIFLKQILSAYPRAA